MGFKKNPIFLSVVFPAYALICVGLRRLNVFFEYARHPEVDILRDYHGLVSFVMLDLFYESPVSAYYLQI